MVGKYQKYLLLLLVTQTFLLVAAKSDFQVAVDAALDGDKEVIEALDNFREYGDKEADRYRAKVFIELINYSNNSITNIEVVKIQGIMSTAVPNRISAGSIQAIEARQNVALKGLEIHVLFRINTTSGKQLVDAYTRVKQRIAGRKDNRFSLTVLKYEDEMGRDLKSYIDNHKSNFCQSSSDTKNHQWKGSGYLIEASGTDGNHAVFEVRVYPTDLRYADPEMLDKLTADQFTELQEHIDSSQPLPCLKGNASKALSSWAFILTGALVSMLLL